jgi:hypothetical protein
LADAKDKGIVHGQAIALWLSDIEVMPLSMRCRMEFEEVVRWILAKVCYWQSERERVRVRRYGVLVGKSAI